MSAVQRGHYLRVRLPPVGRILFNAHVAQLVERQLGKLKVPGPIPGAGSNRSVGKWTPDRKNGTIPERVV